MQEVEELVSHISAESAEVEVVKRNIEADEAVAAKGKLGLFYYLGHSLVSFLMDDGFYFPDYQFLVCCLSTYNNFCLLICKI